MGSVSHLISIEKEWKFCTLAELMKACRASLEISSGMGIRRVVEASLKAFTTGHERCNKNM